MRTCVTIGCVLALLASIGLGDDISFGGLTYSGSTVIDVKDGLLIFRTPGGRTQRVSFSNVSAISLTGLDSFNQAEKLVYKVPKQTSEEKITRRIDAKKAEISKIMAQIGDQAGAITRLKQSAARTRTQADAYAKSATALDTQVADLKKIDAAEAGRYARTVAKAKKLMAQAAALERQGKKDPANKLKKKANKLMKQVESLNVARIRKEAANKRTEARKLALEAKRMRAQKNKDWQNKLNEAKKRNSEAESLDAQIKRIAEAGTARKKQIAKLAKDAGELLRQSKKSSREAKRLDKQAANFPEFAKARKAKTIKLKAEVVELQASLAKLSTEPATKTDDKFPAAIRLYRTAANQSGTPAQKAIIGFRLLSALDKAGWIDEAAAQWLLLADRANGSVGVLACRPKTLASKGNTRNAKAIVVLKSGLVRIKAAKYKATAKDLLIRLMVREGRYADVVKLLNDTDDPKLKVLLATALLNLKGYARAAAVVTEALNKLDRESLPEAISVRAKALLGQSATIADKTKKQDMMLDAAMDFMRVATFFPAWSGAGESLYMAGKIMATMPTPDNRAAINAYRSVVANYAGMPIAGIAGREIKKLGIE